MTTREKDVRMLRLLFAARGGYVPGSVLAEALGVGEAELPACLRPYIEAGYPVTYHPDGGLGLGEPPDIWCAEEIMARCAQPPLASGIVAWDPLLLAETGSTNDVARERARCGAPAGFLVAAARQTRGRGRLGRRWESPAGCGLYVSLLLRPELAPAEAGQLAILASVAAADAVEAIAGLRPQIKWPNDLMLGGRKLAGLLIETEQARGRLAFAVVGIGINVRHEEDDFPPELRTTATSLRLATGRLHRRADLLVALLDALGRRLAAPFAQAREAWAASSLTLGQQVALSTLRGRREGQAIGLDDSGALLLRTTTGEIELVTAGDMQAV